MKYETTIVNQNGSWYARIPPIFAKHMGLKESETYPVECMIQDEKGKYGRYISIWKKEE